MSNYIFTAEQVIELTNEVRMQGQSETAEAQRQAKLYFDSIQAGHKRLERLITYLEKQSDFYAKHKKAIDAIRQDRSEG